MSNQLLSNHQGLREFGRLRYDDLTREAKQERLANQVAGEPRRSAAVLAPISVALTLLLVTALVLL